MLVFINFFLVLLDLYGSEYSFHICALCRFRDELPDPTSQPKLLSIRRDKDRYAFLLLLYFFCYCYVFYYLFFTDVCTPMKACISTEPCHLLILAVLLYRSCKLMYLLLVVCTVLKLSEVCGPIRIKKHYSTILITNKAV